jgi:hypothetical protein
VTYVPIPQGTGPGFAGLFTVDLPQTVKMGQEFDIVARRIGKRLRRYSPAPPPTPQAARAKRGGPLKTGSAEMLAVNMVAAEKLDYERYIVGSFQVKIPVSTRVAVTALDGAETKPIELCR